MLTIKKWAARFWLFSEAVGVAVLVTGCMPAGPRSVLDGERFLREGKYNQAMEKLKNAAALLPQDARVWNYLGLAYQNARQLTNAVLAYQRALTLDPNLAAACYNLGCAQLDAKNTAAALDTFKRHTLLASNSTDGWLKLASAQLRSGKYEDAEKSYREALKLSPRQPEALNGLGVIQLQRKRPRDAYQMFGSALAVQTNYAPALLNVAIVAHQHLNNRPLALQKYREYLLTTPTPANWAEVQKVVRQLESELAPQPRSAATNSASQSTGITTYSPTLAPNDLSATVKPALPPPASSPTKVASPPLQKTNVPINLAQFASPKTGLQPTLPSTPAPPQRIVQQNGALPLASKIKPLAAPPPVEVAKLPASPVEVVKLKEESPIRLAQDAALIPLAERATVAEEPINPAPPEPAFVGSRSVEPREVRRGFLQRANPASWFRSKPKTSLPPTPLPPPLAQTENRAATEIEPPRPSAPSPIKPIAARYTYRSPPKPVPGNRRAAQTYFDQGIQEQKVRRLTSAIASYQAATRADPAFFEAHYNLGLAAFDASVLPQSLSAYETALSINPTHLDTRYNFSLALHQANYFQDAANELEKVLQQAPAETRAHLALANLYAQRLSQPQHARPHYIKVIEAEPDHSQAAAIRSWLLVHP